MALVQSTIREQSRPEHLQVEEGYGTSSGSTSASLYSREGFGYEERRAAVVEA